jgi:hypothetical protein
MSLPLQAVAAGAVALLVAVAGCTSSGVEPSEPVGTRPTLRAPSTPADDPVAAAEHAALDAYRGMWDAYVAAIGIPDPEHPDLRRFAAGDALGVLVEGMESVQRDGLAGRGDVVLDPEVTTLMPAGIPTEAEIVDCVDDSGTELYRLDGQPFDDTPGGFRRAEATIHELDGGAWKVVGFALYGVGSCDE